MAAKKNDPRREARIAKNNRNLNSALTLFTAGFIAEFYLLLINQYFVKGSVDQVVAIAGYLEVMAIVGAAAFGAGVVLTAMRRKWTRFAAAGKWLLGLGLFFGVSSLLMRRVYPMGTTVMCILVPVLMLLAVVFLLYQHEFAVQTIALTLAIFKVANGDVWQCMVGGTNIGRDSDTIACQTALLSACMGGMASVPDYVLTLYEEKSLRQYKALAAELTALICKKAAGAQAAAAALQ